MGISVTGHVNWLAFSSSGSRLAVQDDVAVTVYEYSTENIVFRFTALRVAKSAYSPDGKLLACHGYKDGEGASHKIESLVQIWNIVRNQQVFCIELPPENKFGSTSSLKFSPDSTQLAIVRDDGLVSVIRVATGQVIQLESPSNRFYWSRPSCVFFPGAESLIFTHLDESIKVADINTGRTMLSLKVDGNVCRGNELIGIRPSDQKLLVAFTGIDDYHNRIDAIDVREGVRVPVIGSQKGYKWWPHNCTLSPGGDYIAANVFKEARFFLLSKQLYVVTVWDAYTGNIISENTADEPTSQGLVSSVYSLAFCPTGDLLVGRRGLIVRVAMH